jgi:hypothetical protein
VCEREREKEAERERETERYWASTRARQALYCLAIPQHYLMWDFWGFFLFPFSADFRSYILFLIFYIFPLVLNCKFDLMKSNVDQYPQPSSCTMQRFRAL